VILESRYGEDSASNQKEIIARSDKIKKYLNLIPEMKSIDIKVNPSNTNEPKSGSRIKRKLIRKNIKNICINGLGSDRRITLLSAK
jgi:predicted Fe-Mo cluster-binding NifX family protein